MRIAATLNFLATPLPSRVMVCLVGVFLYKKAGEFFLSFSYVGWDCAGRLSAVRGELKSLFDALERVCDGLPFVFATTAVLAMLPATGAMVNQVLNMSNALESYLLREQDLAEVEEFVCFVTF
jgi:hypothetical protein